MREAPSGCLPVKSGCLPCRPRPARACLVVVIRASRAGQIQPWRPRSSSLTSSSALPESSDRGHPSPRDGGQRRCTPPASSPCLPPVSCWPEVATGELASWLPFCFYDSVRDVLLLIKRWDFSFDAPPPLAPHVPCHPCSPPSTSFSGSSSAPCRRHVHPLLPVLLLARDAALQCARQGRKGPLDCTGRTGCCSLLLDHIAPAMGKMKTHNKPPYCP